MATFKAGFARVNVNPMMGIPIRGYFQERFASGILDDLEINALALACGETKMLLMTLDCCCVNTPEAKIFAITPIWRGEVGEERPMGPFLTVSEIIRSVAAELPNVTVIDAYTFVPQDPACFSPDLLHPVDLGFSHYGRNLVEALKQYIRI